VHNRDDNVNTTAGLVLTGIRCVLGVFWLLQLTWKPPPNFGCPDQGFCLWLDKEIQYPTIPLYADLLRAVVRPNALLFGWFTTIVEVFIGLTLVFGIFTRLGALVGTLWAINLIIGLASVPNEQGWYYAFLIMLNATYAAIGASGQVSVDRARGWRQWWARAAPSIAS